MPYCTALPNPDADIVPARWCTRVRRASWLNKIFQSLSVNECSGGSSVGAIADVCDMTSRMILAVDAALYQR